MFERNPYMPADTPDHMAEAWAACVNWAVKQRQIFEAFLEEYLTENPDADPLDMATMGPAFMAWANKNVWGQLDVDEELTGALPNEHVE